jgi:hypothetical protein
MYPNQAVGCLRKNGVCKVSTMIKAGTTPRGIFRSVELGYWQTGTLLFASMPPPTWGGADAVQSGWAQCSNTTNSKLLEASKPTNP